MKTSKSFLKYAAGALIIGACAVPVIARSGGAAPLRFAQAATQVTAPEGTLTVVAENGVKSETPGMGRLEAGAIDNIATPKIEHDFVLRNDTKKPIAIGRIQAACGCTSVLLGENGETTKTLAPGEQTKVRVSVDVTRFRGTISKAVRAYGGDGNTLLATMEVVATVQEPVTFSTTNLNFGRINYGTTKTAPLGVTISPRLLEKKNLKLVSSSPYLTVEPSKEKAATQNPNERQYVITISPKAPIGYLTGTINFAVPAATKSVVTPATAEAENENRLMASLQNTKVPFMFEVVGKISATPQMVVLAGDKAAKQRVTIASTEPALLKNLKVASSNPLVQTRLVAPAANAKTEKPAATLELSLSPRTPAGALEAQVTITATDGERITVPVIAEVAK